MAQFFEMPAVSPTMEVGTLEKWRIAEGERFEGPVTIAEVGTDKATMEAEIFDSGVLLKHLIGEGDEVPPGTPIAIFGAAGEDISGLLAQWEARKGAAAPAPAPAPAPVAAAPVAAAPAPVAAAPAAPKAPAAAPKAKEWMGKPIPWSLEPPGDLRAGQAAPGRVNASPLARAVAADLGVKLERVQGSGPGGRVTRHDVEAAAKAPAAAPSAPQARADETVKNTQMRKTIAKRLLASHQDIPVFFLTADFDGAGMVALREQLKARLPDVKVSFNDIVVKAVARALSEHPQVNASWSDKEITRHGRVDVGIAVALPDGLITPVLRGADRMGLAEIGAQTRALAARAKEGKLQPEEYTGGTFTISNLGMFEIDQFTAIINPPESAILAVGSLLQVPVVVGGQLSVGWRLKVTMSCDHRVIDGAVGAAFLQSVRRYVECPSLLLV